jgi:hypothetical protein
MRKILIGALIIYVLAGFALMHFHPKLNTTEVLLESSKGRHCEPRDRSIILFWPYFLKYYYGGEFDDCRKNLYK